MKIDYKKLKKQVAEHPFPLVFATISGAHLYGFPSPDSDFDLRGIHLMPFDQVVGLLPREETIEKSGIHDGLEIDIVTHDAQKFFTLMLRRNGYVLEQVMSPLVVHKTPEFDELRAIVPQCITRFHAHHYLGFAQNQWKLFQKESPPRVKPLLYVYRVLLTGIHLMRTGRVESNLLVLNEDAKLRFLNELIDRKLAGPEQGTLTEADLAFHAAEYERLVERLETAATESSLPKTTDATPALHDMLVRLRRKSV